MGRPPRLPDGEVQTERIVIAHYLVHRRADIRDAVVRAENFGHPAHRLWWQAAEANPQKLQPGDLGIQPDAFALLAGIRTTAEQVLEAQKRIIGAWQVRYLAEQCQAFAASVKGGEITTPDQALVTMRETLAEAESGGVAEAKTHRQVSIELFREWSQAIKEGSERTIPMPLAKLTERLGGWQRGKSYLVGAITSNHKTTFARMCCWHAAKCGYRALDWVMEDTAEEMAARTFAAEIKQADTRTFTTFKKPDNITALDFQALIGGLGRHLDSDAARNLRYLDEPMPRLSRVLARLSAEAARGLDFAALDFMQLIQPDHDEEVNETRHWFQVSNALAAAAKRLNIPILITVQPTQHATREQERHQKPLTKGDMRGGSAIAQSAYGVLLFNRVWTEDGELDRRYLDMDIAKWKNADPGTLRFRVERHKDLMVDVGAPR